MMQQPDETLAVLRLAAAAITLAFSVLLWFTTYYLNLLSEAEAEGIAEREAQASSSSPILLCAGVLFIESASILALLLLVRATTSGRMPFSLPSVEFVLLALCLGAPPVGGGLIARIVILQIGGMERLADALVRVVTIPGRQVSMALDLDSVNVDLRRGDFPQTVVDRWRNAYEWVNRNSRRWGLGTRFLSSNQEDLVKLAASCAQVDQPPESSDLEGRLERELDAALRRRKLYDAVVLGRQTQIARAVCYLFWRSLSA